MATVEVRFVTGTINIPNAGTGIPLSTNEGIKESDKVLSIIAQNKAANKGLVFIGNNMVSNSDGWEIPTGGTSPAPGFREVIVAGGYVSAKNIYFDAEFSGEKVGFMAVLDRE